MSSSSVGGEGDVSTFGVSATVCSVSSLADGAAFPRNLSAWAGSLMLAASDGEGRAPGMKISAFHLMPHRELPADFEQRYESVWVTPPWWRAGRRPPGRAVLQLDARRAALRRARRLRRRLHQRAPPERLRLHAEPQPDGQRAGQADQRPRRRHRADGRDAADDQSADPRRRGVRDARLHQRRPAGGGAAARQPDGRQPLLRHHADGAPRALPRGLRRSCSRPGRRARSSRGTASYFQLGQGEPVAAADPAAAPAGVGARLGQHQHLRLRRRARRLLLLPQLLGRARRPRP